MMLIILVAAAGFVACLLALALRMYFLRRGRALTNLRAAPPAVTYKAPHPSTVVQVSTTAASEDKVDFI